LVSNKHPAIKRGWDANSWLLADHVAPSATYLGAKGVIDDHLESLGLVRNVTTRCTYFGLIPEMVASTLLVLTTGRQYCERFVGKQPVEIVSCPIEFPSMHYYQLWHERTHTAKSSIWLRDIIKLVAANLTKNKITRTL
jgi:DNA-binding transcriptional LysR family regulator